MFYTVLATQTHNNNNNHHGLAVVRRNVNNNLIIRFEIERKKNDNCLEYVFAVFEM